MPDEEFQIEFARDGGRSNRDWWSNGVNLKILQQHSPLSDPMGQGFNYAKEFKPSSV